MQDFPAKPRAPAGFGSQKSLLKALKSAEKILPGIREGALHDTDQMKELIDQRGKPNGASYFYAFPCESKRILKGFLSITNPSQLKLQPRGLQRTLERPGKLKPAWKNAFRNLLLEPQSDGLDELTTGYDLPAEEAVLQASKRRVIISGQGCDACERVECP